MQPQEEHDINEHLPSPTLSGRSNSNQQILYIAYPRAIELLAHRFKATSEELAAWIFMGPENSGLAAYQNANELNPPPRFNFEEFIGEEYLSPMMRCWFRVEDIECFEPVDRYITGRALIDRWSKQPGVQPKAFILAKIKESRLMDLHPTCGGTRNAETGDESFPSLEEVLFDLSDVKEVESEDFGRDTEQDDVESEVLSRDTEQGDKESEVLSRDTEQDDVESEDPDEDAEKEVVDHQVGSPEWRSQSARKAANAKHDQSGGSRQKRMQIRAIWATGKYSSRDICAEEESRALNMSLTTARRALRNTPDPTTST